MHYQQCSCFLLHSATTAHSLGDHGIILQGGHAQLPDVQHSHELRVVGWKQLAKHKVVEKRVVHLYTVTMWQYTARVRNGRGGGREVIIQSAELALFLQPRGQGAKRKVAIIAVLRPGEKLIELGRMGWKDNLSTQRFVDKTKENGEKKYSFSSMVVVILSTRVSVQCARRPRQRAYAPSVEKSKQPSDLWTQKNDSES